MEKVRPFLKFSANHLKRKIRRTEDGRDVDDVWAIILHWLLQMCF